MTNGEIRRVKIFSKTRGCSSIPVRCWLAYNLIIMTINVAGSWNFHLDIIAASAGAGPNNAQPGLQLGHYRQHCTCGDTRPVAILKQKYMVFRNWQHSWFLGPELVCLPLLCCMTNCSAANSSPIQSIICCVVQC